LVKISIAEPGMMTHTCHPSYAGGGVRRITILGQSPAKTMRSYLKNKLKKAQRVEHMAQVVEHLLSKWETLSLSHNTAPKIIDIAGTLCQLCIIHYSKHLIMTFFKIIIETV
jgi:hypothetical protein